MALNNLNPEATVSDHTRFMQHMERCGLELVIAEVAHMWAESVERRLLHNIFKGLENMIHPFKAPRNFTTPVWSVKGSNNRRFSQHDMKYRSCL